MNQSRASGLARGARNPQAETSAGKFGGEFFYQYQAAPEWRESRQA
jgi:hypothetical protein